MVRHHVVEESAGDTRVEQSHNVRVLQPGDQLDFLEEPIGSEGTRDLGPEHLEGDKATMP
jgi:hypothetical protein